MITYIPYGHGMRDADYAYFEYQLDNVERLNFKNFNTIFSNRRSKLN